MNLERDCQFRKKKQSTVYTYYDHQQKQQQHLNNNNNNIKKAKLRTEDLAKWKTLQQSGKYYVWE